MTAEQFVLFSEALPEPMLLVSSAGIVLAGNGAIRRQLNVSANDLTRAPLSDFTVESPEELRAYFRLVSRSRQLVLGGFHLRVRGQPAPCRIEGTLLRPSGDGSEALLMLRLRPREETVTQFLALNLQVEELQREIARRKRAESAAREQQERLQVTLNSIGDAVIVSDGQGRVVTMNPVAEHLTGWDQAGARGQPLDRVFHIVNEQTRQPAENPAHRALQAGCIVGLANHTILVARDGRERPIDDSAAPIRDASGAVHGVVLIFRDISERRRHERHLRDESDRKDAFLATLAHELRNPLAPISSGLEALKLAADDRETIEEIRGLMERQTRQLIVLVNDLLDVSRITQNRLQVRKSEVDLSAILRTAVEAARPLIDEAGHDFSAELPRQPVWIDADPHRLAQVFSNLLANAAKFTPRGGRIWLSCETQGDRITISVRDTGRGIPGDKQAQIFDMFYQVDDRPLEREQGGLGLGLTLVKSIVELHQGTIEVRSDGADRGSEFQVQLPLRTAGSPSGGTTLPASGTASVRKLRILVVDDNHAAARTLEMLLKHLGNDVSTASDGQQAVDAASHLRPDVIMMDIGMPRMNGYEAARIIRQQEWGARILLVAVTGWGHNDDKRRTQDAGFDFHLTKPAELGDLQRILAVAAGG